MLKTNSVKTTEQILKNSSSSSGSKRNAALTQADWIRYERQLTLPEFSASAQITLKNSHLIMIGAGGLGSAALPLLAAAGIGKISILDDDVIQTNNLHRQTIYKDKETGLSKAIAAKNYLLELNPDISVQAYTKRLKHKKDWEDFKRFSSKASQTNTEKNFIEHAFDNKSCSANHTRTLLLDGSDNFETKTLLNEISIEEKIPLISTSVNRFKAQCGFFAGYAADKPCYLCLFPELPEDACNCNDAGILGTSAALSGLYQAHMALCYLSGFQNTQPGFILHLDLKNFRSAALQLDKDSHCPSCSTRKETKKWKDYNMSIEEQPIQVLAPEEITKQSHIIIDVRTPQEIEIDPIENALHIELQEIPSRYHELPQDKLLAFACASNIRSMQAAEFIRSMGYQHICVYDKLSA